jgi:toxin-antitoxin system PIN domain toxin
VKLVDANVLLDAVNGASPHHAVARPWLDRALAGADTIAFAWLPLVAFLRIATRPDLFAAPLSVDEGFDIVDGWLSSRSAVVVEPTARHTAILRDLLHAVGGVGGNLVNDAHLAALAIEHRAGIVTYDADFGRFPGIAWSTPD